jgi:hypothetical protein
VWGRRLQGEDAARACWATPATADTTASGLLTWITSMHDTLPVDR